MNEEALLKLWGVIVPILTFIAGKWWYTFNTKRKADITVFKKLEKTLPHNIFRDFIDDTWNMQYSAGYLNKYLDEYLRLIEDPVNNFHNKKLRKLRKEFDITLKKLSLLVGTEFGFPGKQLDIMNLQSVAPHESERYKKVFAEVRRLNNLVDKNYKEYIQAVKKKLFL